MEFYKFNEMKPEDLGRYIVIWQGQLLTANWLITLKDVYQKSLPEGYFSALIKDQPGFIYLGNLIKPDYWAYIPKEVKDHLDNSEFGWVDIKPGACGLKGVVGADGIARMEDGSIL